MLVRIGLLTDGGYPYATGESRLWCDRLVRGLPQHEFDLFALSRSADQERQGWVRLPDRVGRVRTAPMWTHEENTRLPRRTEGLTGRLATGLGRSYGRRDRRRFTAHVTALVGAVCAGAETEPQSGGADAVPASGRFTDGLYGLAELARDSGGLHDALRSEASVRIVQSACRAPGTGRTVHSATVPDYLAFVAGLERALRPLSLDWYEEDSLGAVDLCHAASGGTAALPGLLAKRFFGVPLLVTEHGVPLRAHYLAAPEAPSVRPCAPCWPTSTGSSPPRSTGRQRSSHPATPMSGAGRSGSAPTGTSCARCTRAWRPSGSGTWGRVTTRAVPEHWCGSAASNPPRT